MSATINCQEFAEYFSTPVQQKMIPACVFEVEGEPYAIEDFYLDDLTALFSEEVRARERTLAFLLFPLHLSAP